MRNAIKSSVRRRNIGALNSAVLETLEQRQFLTATVDITAIGATATEAGTAGKFRLSRSDTTGTLTVDLDITGTADNETDYKTIAATASFAAGKSTADITVTPVQDTTLEGNETVIITIATSDDYDITDGKDAATVTIVDDEKPTVTLKATDATAEEADDSETGTFTVARNGPTDGPLTVNLTIAGTATNGTDYETIAKTVTIPDGEESVDFDVTTKQDTTLEGTETVIVSLATGTTYTADKTDNKGTVSIADDEVPEVKITASDLTALEGSTTDTGKFTVSRSGPMTDAVTVKFAVSGSATDGTDFDTIGTTVTIPSGKASADIVIKTKQDSSIELTEKTIVTLSTDDAYTIDSKNKTATVSITDDDKPVVSLATTDDSAAENGAASNGRFTISRTGATTEALTVPYTVAGTATKASDYKTLSGSVVIPIGKASAVIDVKPLDDDTLEGDETVILTLGTGTAFTLDSKKSGTVTIADDEVPVVTLVGTDVIATEPTTDKATLTVSRTGPTTKALVVDLDISGTATNGTDVETVADSVTIPAGKASATITIAPKDDTDLEGTETVIVALADSDDYDQNADADGATVSVMDNEKPVVTMTATDASAAEEDAATGTFKIARTGPTTEALKVTLSVTGTATKATDYKALEASYTIPAGSASKTITVTPIDDTTLEIDETVIATLTASKDYTLGDSKGGTITIAENDLPTVSVVATDAVATEPTTDKATLTFTRNGPTTNALEVKYTVTGTATADDDYTELSGTATIPAGKATLAVTVAPKDDNTLEGRETIIVAIDEDDAYLVDGSKDGATIDLKDNELPVVSVAGTDNSMLENSSDEDDDGTGKVTFTRTGSSLDALDVLYTITGTATSGTDTTEVLTGKVTIPAGSMTKAITITPKDDALIEGDETLIFTMKAGTGYTIPTTDGKIATVTITDDEKPAVSVVATDATGKENSTDGIVFTITRTGATTASLDVQLSTSGMSLPANVLTAIPTHVTIPAGKAFTTLAIATKNTTAYEGTTEVDVMIAEDDAYEIAEDQGMAAGKVTDDELPTVQIEATDDAADEAQNKTGKFTISRKDGDPNTDAVTVTVSAGGTAKNARDYNKIVKTVVIPAGEDSVDVTVTPKTDTLVEGEETVTLTIVPAAKSYGIATGKNTDTVTIADAQKPTVSVEALDDSVNEGDTTGAHFRIWRTGLTSGKTLVVDIDLGDADTDAFTLVDESGASVTGGHVTIPAGAAYVDLLLKGVDNSEAGDDVDVELSISDKATYSVDSDAGSATITIADDDA